MGGQLHAPAALLPGKDPTLSIGCGPQNRSGRCGVEKNHLPLQGIEPRPSCSQPVAIPTQLSRGNTINYIKIYNCTLYSTKEMFPWFNFPNSCFHAQLKRREIHYGIILHQSNINEPLSGLTPRQKFNYFVILMIRQHWGYKRKRLCIHNHTNLRYWQLREISICHLNQSCLLCWAFLKFRIWMILFQIVCI
jgi:hypothetical protein